MNSQLWAGPPSFSSIFLDSTQRREFEFKYQDARVAIAEARVGMRLNANLYTSLWLDTLSSYLSSNLTKESDRLIAMSGIAKIFREVNSDQYLAGLWKDSIHYGFLWRTMASIRVWVQRNESYAPSWSWASVKSTGTSTAAELCIPTFDTTITPFIYAIEARIVTEPPDGDPTGLLRSAELDIECRLFYFQLQRSHGLLEIYKDEAKSQLDDIFTSNCKDVFFDMSDREEKYRDAHTIEGICIPICGRYNVLVSISFIYWLMLVAVDDKYERIGILKSETKESLLVLANETDPSEGMLERITLR